MEILLVAVCEVVCGAESWSEVEALGNAKAAWLEQVPTLLASIPSHDTFCLMFRLVNADDFQRRFIGWVERHSSVTSGQVMRWMGKQPPAVGTGFRDRRLFKR